MNILHVTPYYVPAYAFGGVVRAVESLARAQVEQGHGVTVLTTDALDTDHRVAERESLIDGVRVVRARNRSVWLRGRLNLSTPAGIRRRDLIAAADVIHLHELRTAEAQLIVPLAASLGKPIVLSPHGTLTPTTGRSTFKALWDRLLTPRTVPYIKAVAALTQIEADEVRALWNAVKCPPPHIAVVPNGVDTNEFTVLNGGPVFRAKHNLGNGPVCLFMARLHPRKGAAVLAQAFSRVNLPDARLVIAGPDEGALTAVQQIAAQDSRIVLTGYLGGADRLAALDAADLFALPAVGEGLPMGVLEAMASGLPVLISPGCNLPAVESFGAGVIVPVEIDALSSALQSLLSDANRCQQMSIRARELAVTRFDRAAIAAQIEQLYDSARGFEALDQDNG